jgi:hypothetical protein
MYCRCSFPVNSYVLGGGGGGRGPSSLGPVSLIAPMFGGGVPLPWDLLV